MRRQHQLCGGHILAKMRDRRGACSVSEIVMILHADDRRDPASFRNLWGRDIAQPDHLGKETQGWSLIQILMLN